MARLFIFPSLIAIVLGCASLSLAETNTNNVADDLQKVVVLCATKPKSAEFEQAWAAFVEKHYKPSMDINDVINDVLSRADTYRVETHTRTGSLTADSEERRAIRSRMLETAVVVIRNIG